jgi:L-lactate dehydrogenase complex protein LldG
MTQADLIKTFCAAAEAVGAEILRPADREQALEMIRELAEGPVVLPSFPSGERLELVAGLTALGVTVQTENLREAASAAFLGVTGANFALAVTGTLVLESTPEAIRLASTLPERHVVLLDPAKIITDLVAATPILRRFHQEMPRNFLAYITGPSRTADIERVLTIGVHGPKELFIMLLEGISDDVMEM